MRLAGIGGQHQRHPLIRRRRRPQTDPASDPVCNGRHATSLGAVGIAGKLQRPVRAAGFLERGDAGKEPPVHLGQDHMHRQVRGRQAAHRPVPGPPRGGGERHLEHRNPGPIQRRLTVVPPGREGSGVHNRRRAQHRDPARHPACCPRCLQRRREKRQHVKAPGPQRRDQRLNRVKIMRRQPGAVEDDQQAWPLGGRGKGGRAGQPVFRCPAADLGQGLGPRHRPGVKAGGQRHLRQRRLCCHRAAGIAQLR